MRLLSALLLVVPALSWGGELFLTIITTPPGATVKLDGAEVGQTPMTLSTDEKRHQLEVTKHGFKPVKPSLKGLKSGDRISLTLVDVEQQKLEQAVTRARAQHDKANARLEKLQATLPDEPSDAQMTRVHEAEDAMQRASESLENAEHALEAWKKKRAMGF